MAAAKASLQAFLPARRVERGLQEPAQLGDEALRQGVFTLISEGIGNFSGVVGHENEQGTQDFAIVAWVLAPQDATSEDLETLEHAAVAEILAWCQAAKPAPLDAVYARKATFSRGLDYPVGWVAMELQALYI